MKTTKAEIIAYCGKNAFFLKIKKLDQKSEAWCDAYPIEILSELKRMNAYLVSHPSKRYKDYGRFINDWLARAAGPAIMRPPSVNEILKKLEKTMTQDKPGGIDYQARRRALIQQARQLGVVE